MGRAQEARGESREAAAGSRLEERALLPGQSPPRRRCASLSSLLTPTHSPAFKKPSLRESAISETKIVKEM